MKRRKPVTVLVYEDVLCGWCYVAHERWTAVRAELGPLFRWKSRPFPVSLLDGIPSRRERHARAKELRHAAREPEGGRLSDELWTGDDPPRSSLPALTALEAARLQGPLARARLHRSLQRAALELGINVSRRDVVFELAERAGLDLHRFAQAYASPSLERMVLQGYELAAQRGVHSAPTLVIDGRWMVSGLRSHAEYREILLQCLEKTSMSGFGTEDLFH